MFEENADDGQPPLCRHAPGRDRLAGRDACGLPRRRGWRGMALSSLARHAHFTAWIYLNLPAGLFAWPISRNLMSPPPPRAPPLSLDGCPWLGFLAAWLPRGHLHLVAVESGIGWPGAMLDV